MAILADGVLVAWLFIDRPRAGHEPAMPAMIRLATITDPQGPPRGTRARDRDTSAPRIETTPSDRGVSAMPSPPSSPDIPPPVTPGPSDAPIDWDAAIAEAVRNHMASEEAAARDPVLDAGPEVLQLPQEKERPHQLGDTGLRNGANIVWLDERCYLESEILQPQDMPRKVCKPRSMFDRRSEERAQAIEKAVRDKRSPARAR